MAEGKLSFLSFVRRGLATALAIPDVAPAGVGQTTIRFSLSTAENLTVSPVLSLTGPGDIAGLDPSVIVRTWPRANDFDAEFIPFTLIEFDQADLPWRYTPAAAAGVVASHTDQLRPWFSLVVVPAAAATLDPPSPSQRLAVLNVDAADLPNPADLWAFAHTQFTGENLTGDQIKAQIKGPPGQFVARLMSPRLLQPRTEYLACLVPTFKRGRLVGTGATLTDGDDALDPAWTPTDGPVKLPVYYSWRFATGTAGSFEQLARQIQAGALPDTVGRRDMDVSNPGLGLPLAADGSLPAEGALLSVAAFKAGRPAWPDLRRLPFVTALKALLDAPADASQPLLVPPLYGQWYAVADRLPSPPPASGPPDWFFDLNSDPRDRVAAAQGTAVIQREQQALLAAGWDQVAEIRAVNDKLRVLQLGRGALGRLYLRHFTGTSRQRIYQLTLRVHSRVACGTRTVCDRIDTSAIVPGFLSSQWIRFTSPRGALGRRQQRPGLRGFVPDIIDRLNNCQKPAPEPVPPIGIHDPGDIPGGVTCERIDELAALGTEILERWGLVTLWVTRNLLFSQNGDCWWIAIKALRFAAWLIRIAISSGDVKRRCKFQGGTLTPQDILDAPPMPTLSGSPFASATLPDPLPVPPIPGLPGTFDSPDAAAIRSALVRLLQQTAAPAPLTCPPPMDIETCRQSIVARLVPEETVGLRVLTRIVRDPSVSWNPKDPLEPMFAPPEYERPMYEPLSQISHDWILPGLNQMKPDTAGLAVINQRFIEGYMAGLNHEMTRELLWNEFPTDQRGTYFRQFWDIAGHILEDGSSLPAEQLRDVRPLRLWTRNTALGQNSPRPLPTQPNGAPAPFLVLVVRAQLIQKYPNVIVYAQRVQGTGSAETLTGEQRHPVFYAFLKPDVAFYGFDLTIEQVRGDPSWFFVLQEQPGEPKFAEEGANLAVQKFTTPGQFFVRDDLTNAPVATAATSASQLAKATFLEPFRLGIQGTAMLPEG